MPTKRKTSLQCSALPQTCQPARQIAAKGMIVTRPVMIRSRVSFSTGWMSEGRAPAVDDMRGNDTRRTRGEGGISGIPPVGGFGSRSGFDGCRVRGMPFATTAPLRREIESRLPDRPFTVEFWDGTSLPSTDGDGGPTFRVRSPRAAAHVLRAPGQLGLGRAYVSGELEVDDIDAVIELLESWKPPTLDGADKRALLLGAVRAAGVTKPPPRPPAERRPSGRRHSKERDARAVRHHYDVSNEFFELFLGPTMVYSCAIWRDGEMKTLEEAQEEKLDTVARKLAIKEGERVLDVGCGWGGFPLWAATKYGANVVGITLSPPQAEKARQRAEEAGVADRVDIRVMDYRDLATTGEKFDAIASIGMVEHVGSANIDLYAETLA